MDFTLKTYQTLIKSLLSRDYQFPTVEEYFKLFVFKSPNLSLAIMRHDVDRNPLNALKMAKLEHDLGIKATYYFRTIPKTFKPEVIKGIAELGHEIGYHYENLSTAQILIKNLKFKFKNSDNYEKKLFNLAIDDFVESLEKLREIVPIKNICMHGSPMSIWDSRDLWKKYNYKDYGIISEPYFDINYNNVFYITDTGRQWNNSSISVRDKVDSGFNITIENTNDLINKIKYDELPYQIMINTHPHRWFDFGFGWVKELILQNIKNQIKKIIVRKQ